MMENIGIFYLGKSCLHLAAEKAFLLPEHNPEQKNYIHVVHHLLNKCSANINTKVGNSFSLPSRRRRLLPVPPTDVSLCVIAVLYIFVD